MVWVCGIGFSLIYSILALGYLAKLSGMNFLSNKNRGNKSGKVMEK
jgi:hypothetical protein